MVLIYIFIYLFIFFYICKLLSRCQLEFLIKQEARKCFLKILNLLNAHHHIVTSHRIICSRFLPLNFKTAVVYK